MSDWKIDGPFSLFWIFLFFLVPPLFPLQLINVVSWSPCGQFLAAGSVGGSLNVWDVNSKLCVERYATRAFTEIKSRSVFIMLRCLKQEFKI